MTLKFEIQIIKIVLANDLNNFIAQETGQAFDFFVEEEASGHFHQFKIDGQAQSYQLEVYDEFIRCKSAGCGRTKSILQVLCKNGKLDAGIYFIDSTW